MVGGQEYRPFFPEYGRVVDDQFPAIDTEGGTGQYFEDRVKQSAVLGEYREFREGKAKSRPNMRVIC